MLKTSLANIEECPQAFTITEEETGKQVITCGGGVKSDYFSARMFVGAGLASCLSSTIYSYLKKNNVEFKDINVYTDLQPIQPETKPKFVVRIDVLGVKEEDTELVESLKKNTMDNCFVSGLLKTGFDIVDYKEELMSSSFVDEKCCGQE